MDMHELVGVIAREVMERIRKDNERPCVFVLAQRQESLVATLREKLDGEAELLFLGEDTNNRTLSRCILPLLSCCAMADLAIGRASDATTVEVLRLLLSGAKVEALAFEYQSYTGTAPDSLLGLYESYEKTLEGFGLIKFRPRRPDAIRCRSTLVTVKTVEQAHESGASTLVVPAGAIVTPLAVDAARDWNISILK